MRFIIKLQPWSGVITIDRKENGIMAFWVIINPVTDQNQNLVSINCLFQNVIYDWPADIIAKQKDMSPDPPEAPTQAENGLSKSPPAKSGPELADQLRYQFDSIRQQLDRISAALEGNLNPVNRLQPVSAIWFEFTGSK